MIQKFFSLLENLYISPLEACNLHCQYCYTQKTKNVLSDKEILSFITRYQNFLSNIRRHDFFSTLSLVTDSPEKKNCDQNIRLKSIIFCGGEVFTLKNFVNLVNTLLKKNIFITIITNGTIDPLEKINDPKNCQLIVSFDGPKKIHDQNRGKGNYQKSANFVSHARKLGFPVEIFFLVTKDSYPYLDTFNLFDLPVTYLTDRLGSLTATQVTHVRQHYRCFPPKNFGCSILSLQSDGKFYTCCESNKPIGSLTEPLDKIIGNYIKKCQHNPLCSDPDYYCSLKP